MKDCLTSGIDTVMSWTWFKDMLQQVVTWFKDMLQQVVTYVVSQAICVPFIKEPFQDLAHPLGGYALKNAMNLRITINGREEEAEIGGWFLQPLDYIGGNLPIDNNEQFVKNQQDGFLIQENQTVILYLHGNAETRAQYHRRALYILFQKMGYHVLAIDYRGYGDSSKVTPSQTTMVEDANSAFNWLEENSHPSANIFIWGHSLGTGVTSKLAHVLTHSSRLSGIFLEAPFNRMLDEVHTFRLSRLLPWIGLDIAETLSLADLLFDSTHWLQNVKIPILIMHAEDDQVIPFHLASKLYDDLKRAGGNVQFHSFSSEQRLRHSGIFQAKNPTTLSDIVTAFVEKIVQS